MTTQEPRKWPRRQLFGMVILIFVLQLGLIFWLGEKNVKAARSGPSVQFKLGPNIHGPIAGRHDPTLFALPHRDGFTGPAWMDFDPMNYTVPDWTGPTNLLNMDTDRLGKGLADYVRSNASEVFDVANRPAPKIDEVTLFRAIEGKTQLRFEGELLNRSLVSRPELKPWSAGGILGDTEVQVSVKPDGTVFSAVLVSHSGSKEADDHALRTAKALRFEPSWNSQGAKQQGSNDSLAWGKVIVAWFTTAVATTNAAVAGP